MIKVAVVDASLEHRLRVVRILGSDGGISVVGTGCDGRSAVELVFRTRPDVVAFGLDDEGSDCYHAVQQIMAHRPTAILLMASRGRSQGELVAYLLAAGALDAMERPSGEEGSAAEASSQELLDRVKLLARVPVITHVAGKLQQAAVPAGAPAVEGDCRAVVAIVASTGGPMALTRLLSSLPAGFRAPVMIVQHIAEGFVEGLVNWFQQHCSLEVRVARHGDLASPGVVLVGPDGRDMRVSRGGVIELDVAESRAGGRPAGDRLFQSVAEAYGPKAIGVVLTGMGDDGALGAASIKQAGGRVIAQDESTSVIFGMPAAAIQAGVVDEVLPLGAISWKLVDWIGR